MIRCHLVDVGGCGVWHGMVWCHLVCWGVLCKMAHGGVRYDVILC